MKRGVLWMIIGLCLAGSLPSGVYGQGLYWESVMTGGPVGERTTQMYAMPKKFKAETSGNNENWIVRLDQQLVLIVDDTKREYSAVTFDDMEKMMQNVTTQMDAALAQMRKQMESLPPERRKMIEQMLENRMASRHAEEPAQVSNTGEQKTVSGYACSKFVVTQGDKAMMTIWATKDIAAFQAMRQDWADFSQRMMALSPMGGKGLATAMRQVDGFPMETHTTQGITNTVTKVEQRSTPASAFEVPAGYKKVPPRMLDEMGKIGRGR
jgi:hypothetical protein